MSIRTRLLVLVALAILIPGLVVGVRFFQDRASGIEAAVASLSTTAATISHLLDEKILGTTQLLSGLARASDLETGDRGACSRFLSDVLDEYPQYTGLLTINPDGSLFCDSLQTGRDLDLTDRGYFVEASGLESGVALEPVFGRLTGLPVLQIAHPARSAQGELEFVLLASLNLRVFVDSTQAQNGAQEVLIVDEAGTVLVWTPGEQREALVGTSIADTGLFELAVADRAAHVGEVVTEGRDEVWAVAGASRLADPGVRILVGLPRDELDASANRRLLQDIVTLAVVSVLLFAGVWALAEVSIRRQVGRIAAMAKSLGQGDLGARIAPPHPRGELGQLMVVLNGAAESLERQRAAIEDLNQRLRQSQKLEAVGQLTGGVAHDFNNLLTVILGNAETLADSLTDNQRLRTLAEVTAKAAERGAELISRLLAFSRRQPLDPQAIDVNQQIADFSRLLPRALGEHVEIEVTCAPGLWLAMIDPGQLENALLNLCINARDAMPTGGRLTIETANVDLDHAYARQQPDVEPGQYVMIAVSDTGAGMDATTIERAFEPFFTTKEVGKGSGLGLSMVYGFVKQSLGHVRIYSEVGQGTTVRLYLPRADADADGEAKAADEPAASRGHERILLVEDDELVREYVAGQLDGLGYVVVPVGTGPEAIEALRKADDFDLLFTDVVMPGGMSGRQLADLARELRPALPVLFTSGYTETAIVHHGRLDPGIQLLQKPYRRQDLAAKVRSVLDSAAAARK
ncbi:MAG: ATP-binding protein [Alphaproteobacteria bacterium]